MKLGFGLQMQQTQRLIMTPELRQAITILQLAVTELEEFIEQELQENPVLEVEARESEPEYDSPAIDPVRWLEYMGEDEPSGRGAAVFESDHTLEPAAEPAVTLHEHLLEQLRLAPVSKAERRAGEFLIGNIDDHGYLTLGIDEAAKALRARPALVERVLGIIQSFDPVGAGARDLRECLRLQWATLPQADELVSLIIESHLDDVAAGRIVRIAEAAGVTPRRVQEAVDLIRTLDPKPGRRFGRGSDIRYVVPDVAVERVDGEYVVAVNDGPIPRLGLSHHYRSLLQSSIDPDARRFLEAKVQSALWLMKSIEQRRLTLYRVTEAIVRLQRDFFERGVRALRPLTLREVAAVVDLHESTVSRATSGKYVQTPQGLYELKYFFSSGVENAAGAGVAAGSVQKMIADCIAHEDASVPLSDQAIAEALGRQGVRISRRTVAKYREGIGLPSSAKRKRYD